MLPVIDLSRREAVPALLREACRAHGFFYIVGHGVDEALGDRLEALSREFFALDVAHKMRWRMALGGRAWRGYFPAGGELTSGHPDWKEGLYFGSELPADHPRVRAGTPLHGANLLPDVPGFRETVLDYMAAVTRLGHRAHGGHGARASGSTRTTSREHYTADPLILFRIFNYPSAAGAARGAMGRRRAHRLRPAHAPAPGRRRRPRSEHARRLGRRAALAELLRLQHRRHARSHDRRALPFDAAPRRGQPLGARPAFVPALLRPELRRTRVSRCRACAPAHRRQRDALGPAPTCTPSTAPTATTCSRRCRRCFPSCGARCCSGGPRCTACSSITSSTTFSATRVCTSRFATNGVRCCSISATSPCCHRVG